jgi:hypothetical protein
MRKSTRKYYEQRIEELLERTEALRRKLDQERRMTESWESSFHGLAHSRRQGEEARKWAIDQAIHGGWHQNTIKVAQQIADYVFGPDFTADREEESPTT